MKRLIALVLVATMLFIGCGRSVVIDNVVRKPVGLVSKLMPSNLYSSTYSDSVQYEVCWGNVFWGIALVETIIAPIYFFGFSMFNPKAASK